MLKTHILLVTHWGSGSSLILQMLNAQQKIVIGEVSPTAVWDHPQILKKIEERVYRYKPLAQIIIGRTVYNFQLPHAAFFRLCQFVYLIREPEPTLNYLVQEKGYSQLGAFRYYCYRLRRMCELAKKTPNRLIVNFADLSSKQGLKPLKEFFDLRELNSFYKNKPYEGIVDAMLCHKAQKVYEGYLKRLK